MGSAVLGGKRKSEKRLQGILLILIFWSLAGSSFPHGPQQAQDTETPTVEATETELPSPTATEPEPATPTLEPTSTILPSPTVRSRPSRTPVPPVDISGEYVPDEVLVRFRQRATTDAIDGCLHAARAVAESEIEALSVIIVKVREGSVGEAIARMEACPDIRLAEPNYLVHVADTIPSDPGWSAQYGLLNIRAPEGWDLSTGSAAVTIAIVDTGVDLGHPDLSAKIVSGYDFVNNDATAQDDNGHGTHVAGIAAAITNNGTGVAGVSWGARIMPVKVLDASGNGTFANVAAGMVLAADRGAQVINLSLGGTSGSAVLQSAVDYAYGKGAVIVAAAGNTGAGAVLYPARYPHVIAVAATDNTNTRAGFSNYGPQVALAAPGVLIYSTRPGGTYGYLSGTSMSTPFVSGLAAILRGIPGIGSADAIAWDMESTALDLGQAGLDPYYGYGLIQMDAAIEAALPLTATPTSGSLLPAGGNHVNYPTFQPGYASPTPTFTLTPSLTASPTPSPTMTSTVLAGTPTAGAALGALGAAPPTLSLFRRITSGVGSDWPLGCGGSLLILVGIWQVWKMSQKREHRRPGRGYLKTR